MTFKAFQTVTRYSDSCIYNITYHITRNYLSIISTCNIRTILIYSPLVDIPPLSPLVIEKLIWRCSLRTSLSYWCKCGSAEDLATHGSIRSRGHWGRLEQESGEAIVWRDPYRMEYFRDQCRPIRAAVVRLMIREECWVETLFRESRRRSCVDEPETSCSLSYGVSTCKRKSGWSLEAVCGNDL